MSSFVDEIFFGAGVLKNLLRLCRKYQTLWYILIYAIILMIEKYSRVKKTLLLIAQFIISYAKCIC